MVAAYPRHAAKMKRDFPTEEKVLQVLTTIMTHLSAAIKPMLYTMQKF